MIFKNLLRRKGRTLLTVLGISMGVAAIIGLGALADGFGAGYTSMLTGSKADLILSQPNAFDISLSSVDEQVASELLAMPEVAEVSGLLQGFVQTEGALYFFVFGYPQDSFVLKRFQIVEGVDFEGRGAGGARGKPILLGSAAAESLKKSVGDTLRLTGSVYRIIGIYQTGNAFEDGGGVLQLSDAQDLLGKPRQVSLYYIQLKDPGLGERLAQRVERRWPDLDLSTTGDYSDRQMMGQSLEAFVWIVAGLAIVLGGVGMMNAQLMSVFERVREIGVLRAVGWSSRRILLMVLGESVVVCLLGGVVGVFLGWLAVAALSGGLAFFGTSAANIRPGLLVQAFGVVVTLGMAGGLYPAWRASRLQPIEALRYEGGSTGQHVHRLPVGGMAFQSLWQRSLRTLLTLAVISLTVGAIMALEGIIRGASDALTMIATGSQFELMLRQADVSDTSMSAIDERIGDRIAAMPEVQAVSGLIFTAVSLPETGGFFVIQGYAPSSFASQRFNIVEGEWLTANRQLVLGRMMAETMNKKVGETIELGGTRFRIVGILESGVAWEEMGGIITLRDAQNIVGRPRKVTMYGIKLRDPSQAEAMVAKINQQFPDVHASLAGEFAEQMPDMQVSNDMMFSISFLTIIVGGLGVLNTMLMSVLERTREIGVLRALGWRRRAVLELIMRESLLLATLGGLIGILFAFGLVFLLNLEPTYGSAYTARWDVDIFVRAIVVALTLGLVGGLYPAYRATRLQPVEALRYE